MASSLEVKRASGPAATHNPVNVKLGFPNCVLKPNTLTPIFFKGVSKSIPVVSPEFDQTRRWEEVPKDVVDYFQKNSVSSILKKWGGYETTNRSLLLQRATFIERLKYLLNSPLILFHLLLEGIVTVDDLALLLEANTYQNLKLKGGIPQKRVLVLIRETFKSLKSISAPHQILIRSHLHNWVKKYSLWPVIRAATFLTFAMNDPEAFLVDDMLPLIKIFKSDLKAFQSIEDWVEGRIGVEASAAALMLRPVETQKHALTDLFIAAKDDPVRLRKLEILQAWMTYDNWVEGKEDLQTVIDRFSKLPAVEALKLYRSQIDFIRAAKPALEAGLRQIASPIQASVPDGILGKVIELAST